MAEQAGIESVPTLPKLPAKLERQHQAMLEAMSREWPGSITQVGFEQLNQDQQALRNGTVTFGLTEEDGRQRIDLAWDEQNSTLATTLTLPTWNHCSSQILSTGRHDLGDFVCPEKGSWRLGWPWLTLKQVTWTDKSREPGESESFVLHLEITPRIAADLMRAEREHAVDLTQTLFWSTAQLAYDTAELSFVPSKKDGLDALCQSLIERGLRYLVPAEPHTPANWGGAPLRRPVLPVLGEFQAPGHRQPRPGGPARCGLLPGSQRDGRRRPPGRRGDTRVQHSA
ncbi:hypothetical protein [Streptomyces pratensis]|uniref:hypothetical protein n=1 Tax=Streptomyces pratensis TaxID=1169025 RepID=UPI001933B2A5|nr:hypothetical protein [Streptomyces pratensis]